MYKRVKYKKREKWQVVKLAQNSYENLSMSIANCLWRSIIFTCQKPIACNRWTVVMGGVFWRSGSQEVIKPIITTQLKMEDTCILCNVIKKIW